uniref:Uncharacterized protein n=1 Tax=Oryza barthii TaxID=65489 RepID=A0A0D3H908_9ORYZ
MDRMSGLRERDVSRIGTLLDGIGRCSSLAPRERRRKGVEAGQSTAAAEKAAGSCPHGSQEEESED